MPQTIDKILVCVLTIFFPEKITELTEV